MPKIIRKFTDNFTMVHNEFIDDRELYNASVGLLLKMLKLPSNWRFSIKGLAAICKDGERKITKQLDELMHEGYVSRECKKAENGRIIDWEYFISDEHLPMEIRILSDYYKKKHKQANEAAKQPHLHFADVENADMETAGVYKEKSKKVKNKEIYSSIPQSTCNPYLTQQTEIDLQIHDDVMDMTEQEIDKILSEQVAEPVIDSIAVQCDTADKVDETPAHFDSEEFKKQISFDRLNRDKPTYSAQFKALVNVIGNVLNRKDKLRVSGQFISPCLAKERFSKLRYDHILHVLEKYNQRLRNEKKPNDPRAYLLTMLYNSVDESDDDFMSAFGKAAPEHESSFDIEDLYGLVNNFPGYDYVTDTSCENSNADFYIQAFSENMNRF